jgi:hypothetical protein
MQEFRGKIILLQTVMSRLTGKMPQGYERRMGTMQKTDLSGILFTVF